MSVRIHTENTPNPRTLKFVTSRNLIESGGRDFPNLERAMTSPLAKRLFNLHGVEGVYIGTDFVTVTKSDEIAWKPLVQEVGDAVLAHLASGEPILGEEGAQSHKGGSDGISLRVQEILDEYIRPAVAQDGGDVIFDSYDDGVVRLHLLGSCSGCPSSTLTLKMGIENLLRNQIPEIREVVQV